MKLNKVKIENFLSIGEAEIDFEDFSELVLVEGKNFDTNPTSSNGAGKSSIIEALCFALFGRTIRKTTEKSVINQYTKGKCRVTLTVNDNVVIERTKKPPRLVVKVDDENVTKDGIASTQKYLEKILNMNQSVFLASIVFGQGIKTNFL
jgi:DNA repair exonuclease SbcCD ATPase subunit